MKLLPLQRNEYWRTEHPIITKKRIIDSLRKLGLDYYWTKKYELSSNLHWATLFCIQMGRTTHGKGFTQMQSEVGALAELVERFCHPGWIQIPMQIFKPIKKFYNYTWLKGYQYGPEKSISNCLGIEEIFSKLNLSKEELDDIRNQDNAKIWVDSYSLIHKKTIKVPIRLISSISWKNGLASGNKIEEAIIHAANEIFERYATIKTIRNHTELPTIDKNTIPFTRIQQLVEVFKEKGIEVIFKDMSLNIGLPVIGVLFINNNVEKNQAEHLQMRVGASFFLEEAMSRCFTEKVQGLKKINHIFFNRKISRHFLNYEQMASIYKTEKDLSFLLEGPVINCPTQINVNNLVEEINQIKKICMKLNSDCLIVDFTNKMIGFPVVRVVMPNVSDRLEYVIPENNMYKKIVTLLRSFK